MIRGAEFMSCLCVAAVAHLGLWSLAPGSGATSSGAGGDALTSLQASSAAVAGMVAAWERPPERAEAADAPEAPPQAPDAPQVAALPRVQDAPPRPDTPARPDPDRAGGGPGA